MWKASVPEQVFVLQGRLVGPSWGTHINNRNQIIKQEGHL